MTQPRSQQIKSVNARYSVLRYVLTPAALSTAVTPSDFPYPPGGSAEATQARVRGTTASPFPVLAGDSFTISVDGGPPFVVVLATPDTTAGRVALKVNAALGTETASNDLGHLVLTSNTAGKASKISLIDSSPGVLAKIGLVEGVTIGTDADTDGLITKSQDGLGGVAPLATIDGKNLVTDGGELVYYDHIQSGTGRRLMQLLPGGVPVVGRVTYDGTNVQVGYFAKLTSRVILRSFGSFFFQLDGSNTLSLNVHGFAFNVTFSAGPYTRDQVVDLINAAYATAAGITDPWARIDATVSTPYSRLDSTTFNIQVDGGSTQTVLFGAITSITDVVTTINGQVTGVTASAVTGADGRTYLRIRSNGTNGRTSSLRIFAGNESLGDSSSGKALAALGIRAGLYGGCYVCRPYGPDEIEIFSAFRAGPGPLGTVTLAGSSTTMQRLGLVSGTYQPPTVPTYEPVPAPFVLANEQISQAYSVLLAYPAVLEFGDVPGDADVAMQEYLAKSAGTNVNDFNRPVFSTAGQVYSGTTSRGFFDAGKPIVMSPDGTVSADAGGGGGAGGSEPIAKQITRLSATDVVQAVAGALFETPGRGGNPLPISAFMDFFADSTNDFAASTRGFRWVDPSGVLAQLVDDVSGAVPLLRSYLGLRGAGRSLYFPDGAAKVSDINIAGVEPTNGYLPLSSSTDNYLRIAGKRALPSAVAGYNLLQSVNSRYEVVLGDGTNSFGDFNGPGALKKARDFLVTAGATRARIVFQPGSYSESSTSDFSGFRDVEIDGIFPTSGSAGSAVTVQFGSGSLLSPGIQSTTNLTSFCVRNVNLTHGTGQESVIDVQAFHVVIQDCILNSPVKFTNSVFFRAEGTISGVAAQTSSSVQLVYTNSSFIGSTNTVGYADVRFIDCQMSSGQNAPVIRIDDAMSLKQLRFNILEIDRCIMTPGNVSVSSQVILAQHGIGVLGIEPVNSSFVAGNNVGIMYENIRITNTDIISGEIGFSDTYAPTSVFLLPGGAGGPISWFQNGSPGCMLNNVTIENVNVSIPGGANFTTASGFNLTTFCVAGVGIQQYGGTDTRTDNAGVLTVTNLTVDQGLGIPGPGSTSMTTFLADFRNPSGDISDVDTGLIALSSMRLRAKDIVVKNSVAETNWPTLFLASYAEMSLDGFYDEPRLMGYPGGFFPTSRLRIRDVFISKMDLKNIHFWGNYQTYFWWGVACIVFDAMNPRFNGRTLSNFSIRGFSGNLNEAIVLAGFMYPSNGVYKNQCGGITIQNGYVGMDNLGFTSYYNAIRCSVSNTLPGGNVTIRDVAVDGCVQNGMFLFFGPLIGPVLVEGCSVQFCGNTGGYSGIFIVTQNVATAADEPGSVTLVGNTVGMNNLNSGFRYDGIQINVRDTGSSVNALNTCFSAYGNMCGDGFGGYGKINSCANHNTNLPTVSSTDISVNGLETGYTGQTGSFASLGNGRIWTSGGKTMHNNAYLSKDYSYPN